MESVLVTGANGQLGNALRNGTSDMDRDAFYFTDVDTLDVCDKLQLKDFVNSYNIRAIVNCAAYTAVDRAEDEPELCARINCDAVRYIGEVASTVGARVIHISTDYVFDGCGVVCDNKSDVSYTCSPGQATVERHIRPYCETDATYPVSVYGKTKISGEKALFASCKNSIILRTSWLYSETGTNFVKTMIRIGKERGIAGVVADQYGTPTYAGDLAKVIKTILSFNRFVPGIFHYSNEGMCTWYEFALKIFELSNINCTVKPLTTADYPTRAARPAYSVLDKTKIKKTFALQIPTWESSLSANLHAFK